MTECNMGITFGTQLWLFINSYSSEEKWVADKASGYKGGVVGGGGRRRGSTGRRQKMDRAQVVRKVLVVSMIIHYWDGRRAWMSGATNLTLSLMDRTQLPWEWEVGERGEAREREPAPSISPPPLCPPPPFLSFFLFPLLSPGRLYCSCRWFLGIKLLLAASCLSSHTHTQIHTHTYSRAHMHTRRQILTSPTRTCWQRPIYGRPIYSSFLSPRVSSALASDCCLNPDTLSYVSRPRSAATFSSSALIPGQTATTVFTMAFDGAALPFMLSSLCVCVYVRGRGFVQLKLDTDIWEINLFSPPGTIA